MPLTLPFGSWPSPISAADAAAATLRLDGARFAGDGDDAPVWWAESMPTQRGRIAVRRMGTSGIEDVLPEPWSARSRVHEYGGGAWTVSQDAAPVLYFVEHSDQRIWRMVPGEAPSPLTPDAPDMHFGGLEWQHGRLIAVRERPLATARRRDIVEIPLDGSAAEDPGAIRSLVAGSDFVAQPRLSPRGDRLAWIAWDHPAMPWDRAELRVGAIEDGTVREWSRIEGGGREAALQPEWTSDTQLIFSSDPRGRWNLRCATLDESGAVASIEPVAAADADTGGALWVLGTRWYLPLRDGRIVAVQTQGSDRLVVVDPRIGSAREMGGPLTSRVEVQDVRGTRALVVGAGGRTPPGVWVVDVDRPWPDEPVRIGGSPWDPHWLPTPQQVSVDGPRGEVHAIAYPPTNPDVVAPSGELPPYLVKVHGGPTSHVAGEASAQIAYFTSRGIGVLEVNYGGSTGYGRAYRERLLGQFGVVDVEDVAAAARGFAERGGADAARLVIEGGSSGGWTVYCALTDTSVFAAGISRYGVADLRALAADTHDFESRYLDGLVGPLPAAQEVYVARSPLSHAERFQVPLLLLQGSDDRVVPPAQSEAIRDALAENGIPHAYIVYDGEGHGFRRAETMVSVLESELSFLGQVLGFATPGVPTLTLSKRVG